MEILNNFGFEPILFVAQIVNFVIVYLLLKKFLYKPLLNLLKERRETIAQGLQQAEEARRLLEETLQKEEKILKSANEKARQLIEEAKVERDAIMKQSEEDGKKIVSNMIADAELQIKQEVSKAQKDLSTDVSRLAVEFLEKSLENLFDEKDQEKIMKNAIGRLKKN